MVSYMARRHPLLLLSLPLSHIYPLMLLSPPVSPIHTDHPHPPTLTTVPLSLYLKHTNTDHSPGTGPAAPPPPPPPSPPTDHSPGTGPAAPPPPPPYHSSSLHSIFFLLSHKISLSLSLMQKENSPNVGPAAQSATLDRALSLSLAVSPSARRRTSCPRRHP